MSYIHPSAHVDSRAKIGEGTKIWINVQVREEVTIGTNCVISKDVYIDKDVRIGNNCKVQNSVSVYHGVTIEDDVFVGPNVTFTNDRVPRAFGDWKVTPTLIKKGASLGANCTIVCGITIGEYALIAAGSVVTKDGNRIQWLWAILQDMHTMLTLWETEWRKNNGKKNSHYRRCRLHRKSYCG